MANTFCRISGLASGENGGVTLTLDMYFNGPDVALINEGRSSMNATTTVELAGTETVAQVRTALASAIQTLATGYYGLTAPATNMVLPAFQKG